MKIGWSVLWASAAVVALAVGAIAAAGDPAGTQAKGKAPNGKDLFVTYKCTNCHSIEAEKIEKKKKTEPAEGDPEGASGNATASSAKDSDLSGVGTKKDAAWMSQYLMKEVKVEEKLHKAKFRGTPEELQTLCGWLGTLKTPAKSAKTP